LVIFPSKVKIFDLIVKRVPDFALSVSFCHEKKLKNSSKIGGQG